MDVKTQATTAAAASPAPVVEHDRQVTPTAGSVKLGRWTYPARVYEGVAQYQTREGEWVDVPADTEGLED